MKTAYTIVPVAPMADPKPDNPTPAIPIRIVSDDTKSQPAADDASEAQSVIVIGGRRDDFYPAWDKFLVVDPKRAKTTSRAARKIEEQREAVEATPGDGLQIEENAAKSWEEAAAECKAKVAAIVDECVRLNQKYRDAIFDLESNPYCLQNLMGRFPKAVDKLDPPPWIKRVEDIFDEPQFFIDGASAADVHQGNGGDCWFLASLMAVSAKKELIDRLCIARNEKVGVYGFVFYRDGEWVHEVIDDKLFLRVGDDDDLTVVRDWDCEKKEGSGIKYDDEKLKLALQRGGLALYFSHCKSSETWLPLIEKAYAKAHGDYVAIEGGFAGEGIEDLTGGVAVVLNPEDIMDKEIFWREQLSQVNEKYLFGGGTTSKSTKGFIGGHAYAVLEAWEESDLKLLKLRNPWGEVEWDGDWSDGSKLWTAEMMIKLKHTFGDDGIFWISYKDFLKHFSSINRVRLFDETWSVGQQWTCVEVPWTVDYLDTHFKSTITERGPVVIVLAQPDDRYFYGLRGRFLYSLHFRVYREGDESHWIVRSMHNSGNESLYTRSVSAEINDLEPGTYDVIFKITAMRSPTGATAEDAILKFAIDRKEKLLHVGRRFDYAQSKGNLRNMEKEVRLRKVRAFKKKVKESLKTARKMSRQDREQARRRKKRAEDAMREKRKAFETKQREKARARQQRAMARRVNLPTETEAQAGGQSSVADGGDAAVTPPSNLEQSVLIENPAAAEMQTQREEERAKAAAAEQPQEDAAETKETGEAPEMTPPEAAQSESGSQALSQKLRTLSIKDNPTDGRALQSAGGEGPTSAIDEDESDYDSPPEPPEDLEDDDFSWDSDIDGPIYSDTSDCELPPPARRDPKALFPQDPWNALCVLGLRVYSQSKDVKVRVVKIENNS